MAHRWPQHSGNQRTEQHAINETFLRLLWASELEYSRNVGIKRNVSMETQSNVEELETCQIGKVVIEPWPCGRSFKDSTYSTALIATRRSYITEQEEETIGRISISLEWNDHVRGPRVRLVHAVLCTWHCARNGTAVRLDVVSMRATMRFEVCHVCVCPTVSSVGRPLFP